MRKICLASLIFGILVFAIIGIEKVALAIVFGILAL
jgi:hypothetical protein